MRNGIFGSLLIWSLHAGMGWSDEPRLSGPALSPEAVSSIDLQTPPVPENGFGRGSGRFWVSAEFLLWWIKDGNTPPLATTGTPASGGILGQPGTTTLFGGSLDYGARPGARFTFGTWLDCERTKAIELSYFFLNGGPEGFGANSAGDVVLSRPFINVINGQPFVEIVAFPGLAAGGIGIFSNSALQGADLNLFCNLCCRPACSPCSHSFRLDLLGGPRWLDLQEDLAIAELVTDDQATFAIVDAFETRNSFYGAQLGARAEWQRGRWFANLLGKVALGTTHQEVRISGTTVITVPGAAPSVQTGGLLALPTNIGSYSRNTFTVVPEIGMNVGCQLTNRVRAFAGYNFLYWSNVVRPGDQIDLGINPTQLPSAAGPGTLVGPARPAFTFQETDFWAHGLNAGLEFSW